MWLDGYENVLEPATQHNDDPQECVGVQVYRAINAYKKQDIFPS